MMNVEHLVYGKLVQEPEGDIVPGSEHQFTGRSVGFPSALVALCHPARLGLGGDDLVQWDKYPWLSEGGGFVCRPVVDGNNAFVLCARVVGRPEYPSRPGGRFYTQAHYAAVPAALWHSSLLPCLAKQLRAEPMTRPSSEMPPIEVTCEPATTVSLPVLDDHSCAIRQTLEILMSGASLAVQRWDEPVGAFLDHAALCLALLPPVLAWRVTVGAGLVRADGSVAIGHGMKARGIRVVAGELRGAAETDLSPGRLYVEWLQHHARCIADIGDLHRIFREDLGEHFTRYDGLPVDNPWQQAVAYVADSVRKSTSTRALRIWLAEGRGQAPALDGLVQRPAVLVDVLRTLRERGMRYLPATLEPGWLSAWQRAVALPGETGAVARAVASALGLASSADPRDLEVIRDVAFPPDLEARVVRCLSDAFRRHAEPRRWLTLLSSKSGDTGWVAGWRLACESDLFVLALAQYYLAEIEEPLRALSGSRTAALHGRVLRGEARADEIRAYASIVAHANRRTRDAVVADAFSCAGVWTGIALVDEMSALGAVTTDAEDLARDDFTGGFERRIVFPLVKDLTCAFRGATGSMVRLLALHWGSLPADQRTSLEASLAPVVGSPLREVLWGEGVRGAQNESTSRISWTASLCASAATALEQAPERVGLLLPLLASRNEQTAAAASELIRTWALRDTSSPPDELARFVSSAVRGTRLPPFPQRRRDRDGLEALLVSGLVHGGASKTLPAVRTLDDVLLIIRTAAPEPVPVPGVQVLSVSLGACAADPGRLPVLRKALVSKRWTDQLGWRVFSAPAITRLHRVEREAFSALSDQAAVRLFQHRVHVPLSRLHEVVQLPASLDPTQVAGLVNEARRGNAVGLLRLAAVHAIRRARAEGRTAAEIEAALLSPATLADRIGRWLKGSGTEDRWLVVARTSLSEMTIESKQAIVQEAIGNGWQAEPNG